ncbi:hypothetical protein AcW1_003065 [Taiwanofungus camphoratus]|nr:hypothetical protein AcV5_001744 [Antrodia cinnamomea]KAI0942432.1 hypothetical protein AcW1_003065 [Antrodia cinnamomea]
MVCCECEVEGRSLRATPRRESGCASCPARAVFPLSIVSHSTPSHPTPPHPTPSHPIQSSRDTQRYPLDLYRETSRDVYRTEICPEIET